MDRNDLQDNGRLDHHQLLSGYTSHLLRNQTHPKIPKTLLDMVHTPLIHISLKFYKKKYLILFILEQHKGRKEGMRE